MELVQIANGKSRSLCIAKAHQKLILIALVKSNFDVEDAFEINCSGDGRTLEEYRALIRKYFPCGVRELRKQWRKSQVKKN